MSQIQKYETVNMLSDMPAAEALAHPDVSDFEHGLFADGVYIYDPTAETSRAEDEVANSLQWYKNNPYWDDERTRDSMQQDILLKRWELAWKQRFSGRVPKNWDSWSKPMFAMEEAGKRGLQLSSVLVDAGISHDHHLVANRTGKNQTLSTHQMAIAFARGLPKWNLDEIVEAQVAKGMTREEMAKAREMAAVIRKKMSEGTIQLTSGGETIPPSREKTRSKRRLKGLLRGAVSR